MDGVLVGAGSHMLSYSGTSLFVQQALIQYAKKAD
jgi:hypothetical protein